MKRRDSALYLVFKPAPAKAGGGAEAEWALETAERRAEPDGLVDGWSEVRGWDINRVAGER